ncbi:MAG: LysR family transcriptional regulator [Pseudomonadota bacterium]
MIWSSDVTPSVKVWLLDPEGESLFGPGGLLILETIGKTGSINSAAKELSMGYRAMWGKIRKLEQRLGEKLLITSKGGITRGTSILTPFAVDLMDRFKDLQTRISHDTEQHFHEVFK